MTLTCSNIQRKIRALGLIPSNIQRNYQFDLEPIDLAVGADEGRDALHPRSHLQLRYEALL